MTADARARRPITGDTASVGGSIAGGYVYRGSAMPGLRGTYFCADFCSARVGALRYQDGEVTELRERTSELGAVSSPASFGEDASGELVDKVFEGVVRGLERVREQLDSDALGRAIEAIARARRVSFHGVGGGSNVVAPDAQLRFFRLNMTANA